MDINDNKLKRFYTISAAIGYILCSLYAFIYCASYGLVHLHLPISSESVLSGVFDDFFYFSEAIIGVLLVFGIVCVGSYLALLFIAFDKGHRPLPFRLSIITFHELRGIRQARHGFAYMLHRAGGNIPAHRHLYCCALRAQCEEINEIKGGASMKKLGKVLTVLLPVVALFLESLPYGAVLIFKDFPDRTIRTTYSYFSPTPWGYANFPPGITALLTCVLLMAAILAAAKDSRKALLRVFGISLAAAVISPMQLLYNIKNFSVTGCLITVTLAAECVLSGVLARRK